MSGRAQAGFESATMRAGLERYDRGGTRSAQERVKAGGGARRRRWLSLGILTKVDLFATQRRIMEKTTGGIR